MISLVHGKKKEEGEQDDKKKGIRLE